MQPEGQVGGALDGASIGLRVGPFTEHALDEALGLAAGSGRLGAGAEVFEFQASAEAGEAS